MKKFLFLLLSLLTAFAASAYYIDGKNVVYVNGIYYDISTGFAYVTHSPTGNNKYIYTGHVNIPSEVKVDSYTYKVTAIAEEAFMYSQDLKSVTVPNTVLTIRERAFSNCPKLESVELPESLLNLYEHAFAYCGSLTTINIPESVTYFGRGVFTGSANLASFQGKNASQGDGGRSLISSGVLVAFAPAGITSYTIPSSVKVIGEEAFSGCNKLEEITIPNTVTKIKVLAFNSCHSLTKVKIPESVTTIESGAFSNCSNLATFESKFLADDNRSLIIDNTLVAFASAGFEGEYKAPEGLQGIGYGVFRYCTKLTKIKIPHSVTSIGNYAFDGCSGLKEVSIPVTVTSMGTRAFGACTSLATLAMEHDRPSNIGMSVDVFADDYLKRVSLIVPKGATDNYMNSDREEWRNFKEYEEKDFSFVEMTPDGPLYYAINEGDAEPTLTVVNGYYDYKKVTVPPTVTHNKIQYAVTAIGDKAFFLRAGMEHISIPDGVKTIGKYAFSNCASLQDFTVPMSVTSIGDYAFKYCPKLNTVTAENSTPTPLGTNVFEDVPVSACTLYVPRNAGTAYSKDAQWGQFTTVKELGAEFYEYDANGYPIYYYVNNAGLKTLTVTYNSPNNFNDYSGNVVIPEKVSHNGTEYTVSAIGSNAFRSCAGLNEVSIPKTVTSIFDRAFYGCDQLRTIRISNAKPETMTMGADVFQNVQAAAEVYVPRGCYKAYAAIQQWADLSLKEEGMNCHFCQVNAQGILLCYNINDGGKSVTLVRKFTFGNDYSGEIDIPATVTRFSTTYAVTAIDAAAFQACEALTSVNIPEGVETIYDSAFGQCTALTTVTIPKSVKNIYDYAFNQCKALKQIYINNPNPAEIKVSDELFGFSTSGIKLYVPYGSKDAYKALDPWRNFDIEEAHHISFSEENKDGILIHYIINDADPSTVSVTYSGRYYSSYSGYVEVPSTVSHDGETYTVTAIGESAFRSCSSLWRIIIPETVTEIGAMAFSDSKFQSLILPWSVNRIDDGAFKGCTDLKSLTVENTTPPTLGADVFLDSNVKAATLNVPKGCKMVYFYADQWTDFLHFDEQIYDFRAVNNEGVSIYCNINEDDPYTVYVTCSKESGDSYSGKVNIPSIVSHENKTYRVTSIGELAFHKCSYLISVDVPNSVTTIANMAFYNSNLGSVTLPETLTSIGLSAFADCSYLASVEIPELIQTIPPHVFENCTNLKEVNIPADVKRIYYGAFSGCTSLAKVTSAIENPADVTYGANIFEEVPVSSCKLYVPRGCKEKYDIEPWRDFDIEETELSGIEDVVEASPVRPADNVYYDLQGRRVKNPTHGLYILNGRKVLVK